MTRRTLSQVITAELRVRRCGTNQGRIYVLRQRDGHGYIKIGTTIDLLKRIGDHQGNAYGELEVLAVFHGNRDAEQALHRRFGRARVFGNREHFHQTRELLRWVEDVQRLNFRDDAMCWSCRDAAVQRGDWPPPTLDSLMPCDPGVIEVVDERCGLCREGDFGAIRWFNRESRSIEFITHARGESAGSIEGANALARAPSWGAWALALIHQENPSAVNVLIDAMSDLDRCQFESSMIYAHHASRTFAPFRLSDVCHDDLRGIARYENGGFRIDGNGRRRLARAVASVEPGLRRWGAIRFCAGSQSYREHLLRLRLPQRAAHGCDARERDWFRPIWGWGF